MPRPLPCLAAVLGLILAAPARGGAVYNLSLVTDNVPDYTDLPAFVRSATGAFATPQEKAIAVWRWGRRGRRQTACALEGGRNILDPILAYTSYGALNCGIVSSLNVTSFVELGYRARYLQLGDHTVCEVSFDDGATWHLFDSSMSIFCFNHEGKVASAREVKEAHACELSGGKAEPGHYYLYHAAPQCASHAGPTGWRIASDQPVGYERTLLNGASSYTDGFSVDKYCQVARSGHRYTLNLRPGETYVRYWRPLARGKGKADVAAAAFFRPMPDGSDPDAQHGLNNLRSNGRWTWPIDLASKDVRKLMHEDANLATRAEDAAGPALHAARAGEAATATFKVHAANVITSMRIDARAVSGPGDALAIAVSRDQGISWTTVWTARSPGNHAIDLALRDEVAGVTQCLVRLQMKAAAADPRSAGFDALNLTTITQVNRLTLPKLTLGSNAVHLRAGEQTETAELWPPLHAGLHKRTIHAEDSLFADDKPDGMYKATLGAAVNGRDCWGVWRLAVPSDITGVEYHVVATNRSTASSVALGHSWDGQRFDEFFRKSDGAFPFDQQVRHTIAAKDVPPGARQAFLRGVFRARGGAGTYGMPGLQDVLIRVRHAPRDAAFRPVEVTYAWVEHRETGDVERSHTEVVRSLPHRYSINTAGRRDPTMLSVTLRLADERSRAGYSDGVDVGPAHERPKVVYAFDEPLHLGRPYAVSRPASEASGNADSGGTELTNGIVIAPTDSTRSKPIQPAVAYWDAGEPVVVTLDLGAPADVAGLRISTHQPSARYAHPARVDVSVSDDGRAWRDVGVVRHDDLFHPPGDYEPWEHDDDPAYDALPALGRLAYSFPLVLDRPARARHVRFTVTPLAGRGMGLSELAVYGRATVRPWPADILMPAP